MILGIIGGGQLGMMICEAAKNLNVKTIVLDPNKRCPSSYVCDELIVADFNDKDAIKTLCQKSDAVTYEFENIPYQIIKDLESKYNIPQGHRPLYLSQHRYREKTAAINFGINPVPFKFVKSKKDLISAVDEFGYPSVIKTCSFGYDGKGQVVMKNDDDLKKVLKDFKENEYVLEKFIEFDFEVSVIIVRGLDGTTETFPIPINEHKNNILHTSSCPNGMTEKQNNYIRQKAVEFMRNADLYGILTIELFVRGDEIFFNEMAPRPHNSGHYTIEGCNVSQFEQLIRSVLGMNLITPKLLQPTVMVNVLGQHMDKIAKMQDNDQIKVHLYNKDESKINRKMGHVTFLDFDKEELNNIIDKKLGVDDNEKLSVFVEKKEGFNVESKSLLNIIKNNLNIDDIKSVRILNTYDIFNINDELLNVVKKSVFSEVVTDQVYEEVDLKDKVYFAVEYLPGQFDQRADSAEQCISLINPDNDVTVRSGKLIILDGDLSNEDISTIKKYYINEIESRIKDLNVLELNDNVEIQPVPIYEGFINFKDKELEEFKQSHGLAMSYEDLKHIQLYFKNDEDRNPTETEIKMLDTYWSDHCRHTTFETLIKNVDFEEGRFTQQIQETYNKYLELREYVHGNKKPQTLMDMATICGKYEFKTGNLDDLEISDEINACSVYIDVKVDSSTEKWLLMFKNETHNHPTEIEPFGGASTCVGGAIRDPLSGRSYVYQAMRITGAADPTEAINQTIEGKLPQQVISKKAADGYSSYGNQIGLATTFVKEVFHEGYRAKRMEVGAVVGAVPAHYVRREKPKAGDIIILLGGRTGRDGVGGATGSSKVHTKESLETSSAEVQKGNAPEERKIQRLFRNEEVTKLIKKSNDFGAGGVSVAIGELADGLTINLDNVPTKYAGLNGTELAISESQERMSVVVESKDVERFIELANKENIEAVVIAEVTDTNRLTMFWRGTKIVDLSRDFINTNGVRQETEIKVANVDGKNPFKREVDGSNLKEKLTNHLQSLEVSSQKGLKEMFDSTIGSTTVLMPYGGKYQLTETQASVQKIPVLKGETSTASIMTYGYNPYISKWSPYHGAAYAVLESIAKVVAVGGSYEKIRFSFQEYFERLDNNPEKWGKPFAALLGSIYMQNGFNLPSIGGKDSMSGTFNEIHVPPTLISFAVTTEDVNQIISQEFKKPNNNIYLIKHHATNNLMPNIDELKDNYRFIHEQIKAGNIVSAYAVQNGGLSEAIVQMGLGNKLGATIYTDNNMFDFDYGSIVVESNIELDYKNAQLIGNVTSSILQINNEKITYDEIIKLNNKKMGEVFPSNLKTEVEIIETNDYTTESNFKGKSVKDIKVLLPVFPGTNCEYDTMRAFEEEGAVVDTFVFKNQTQKDIEESIAVMSKKISESNIICLSGGFSSGDEPDGSGKFIATVLNNETIKESINKFLEEDGLMLGICNGFQALVKSGLLPNGELGKITENSPTLTTNDINRHISHITTTRVASNNSPWLSSFNPGETHKIAVSHGEGKFVVDEDMAKYLFDNGMVAFQYCDFDGNPTMDGEFNPNGSSYAIEGIVSKCGHILGKMGHSERKGNGLYKNIPGNKEQNIFKNAINYFK